MVKATIRGVVTFLVIGLLWEICAYIELYNTVLLPPPSKAITAFATVVGDGTLASDAAESAKRFIPGFLFGSAIGIFAGVMTGISAGVGHAVNPIFHYLRAIPPVALIPFVLVLFGIDDIGKVTLVAWAVMFPVWLNTQSGIKQVPQEYLRAARIFGSNGYRRIIDVWLPSALPHIIAGVRIAVATGIFALAAAEMFAASSGIGFRIVYSHQLFQTDTMVAMILFIGVIALLIDSALVVLRKYIAPWEME